MTVVQTADVLTVAQCDEIIACTLPLLTRSRMGERTQQPARQRVSGARTSYSRLLKPGDVDAEKLDAVAAAVAEATGVPRSHQEPFSVLRYQPGQWFRAHRDQFPPHAVDASGQRTHTVIFWLRAPEAGGALQFPVAGEEYVRPAGTLLAWPSQSNPYALHASSPVLRGEKWVMVTWVRERPIETT